MARQLQGTNSEEQIQINREPFLANSFECPGSNPVLSLTILKSYNEARSSLQKLNHLRSNQQSKLIENNTPAIHTA